MIAISNFNAQQQVLHVYGLDGTLKGTKNFRKYLKTISFLPKSHLSTRLVGEDRIIQVQNVETLKERKELTIVQTDQSIYVVAGDKTLYTYTK